MREHPAQGTAERGRGDARRVRHMVASAEHPIDASLRRKKPTPPRQVQVRKTFHRKEAEVDGRGVGKTDSDELRQERVQIRPAFKHFLIEISALFARE